MQATLASPGASARSALTLPFPHDAELAAPIVTEPAGKPAGSPPARIDSLDAARFFAMLGIVYVHAVETPLLSSAKLLGTFGVPFYLFATLYFQARAFHRDPDRPLHHYIVARAKRLYLPFLSWALIYFIARNIKHMFLVGNSGVPFEIQNLWVGTAHQLWFLPLLMVVTILSAVACRLCITHERWKWRVVIASAIIGTVLAVMPRPDWLNYTRGDEGYFFFQSWRALPSVFLGLALAWWLVLSGDRSPITPSLGFVGLLITAAMIADQIVSGYSRLDRTLSGMGWLLVALASWRGPFVSQLARLGRYSYGIYLSHVLVIETMQALAHQTFKLPQSYLLDVGSCVGGLLGGLGIAYFLSRHKSTAWLNGD